VLLSFGSHEVAIAHAEWEKPDIQEAQSIQRLKLVIVTRTHLL
jgi:hypothetical protein